MRARAPVLLTGIHLWLRRQGGQDVPLTVDNVEEYVELLPKVILVDAVSAQLDAFRKGFWCV